MKVSEVFYSIQGESRFAGRPCVFVRLAGCPLDCAWCDTRYARRAHAPEQREMSLDQIVEAVTAYDAPLVEVTGGEPLAQDDCPALLSRLADTGRTVLLETSGALSVAGIDGRVIRIVDVKCPSSGMAGRMDFGNFQHLRPLDELKFVVADRADFDYALDLIGRHHLDDSCLLNFSPVAESLDAADLAAWLLADLPVGRLNLQLHRVIWPGIDRGV